MCKGHHCFLFYDLWGEVKGFRIALVYLNKSWNYHIIDAVKSHCDKRDKVCNCVWEAQTVNKALFGSRKVKLEAALERNALFFLFSVGLGPAFQGHMGAKWTSQFCYAIYLNSYGNLPGIDFTWVLTSKTGRKLKCMIAVIRVAYFCIEHYSLNSKTMSSNVELQLKHPTQPSVSSQMFIGCVDILGLSTAALSCPP